MTVTAVYSSKGGVGKSTGAVNLAHVAARDGRRTLVWDLDGQAAATYLLGAEPGDRRRRDLAGDHRRLADEVVPTPHDRLELVPASPVDHHLDAALASAHKPRRLLTGLLADVLETYDEVFLDCPPGMSKLADSVVRAADVVLVPLLPSPLAVRAFDQLYRHVAEGKQRPEVLAYFSMVDGRRRLHRELVEGLGGVWPGILAARIPYASDVERMGAVRAPLVTFAPRSRAAMSFEALASELRSRPSATRPLAHR